MVFIEKKFVSLKLVCEILQVFRKNEFCEKKQKFFYETDKREISQKNEKFRIFSTRGIQKMENFCERFSYFAGNPKFNHQGLNQRCSSILFKRS